MEELTKEYNKIKDDVDTQFNKAKAEVKNMLKHPIKSGIKLAVLFLIVRWIYRKLFK